MDVRERLIELLLDVDCVCKKDDCQECIYSKDNNGDDCFIHRAASHLVNNGVTVQEWISVKDRLPEDGEIVLVCGSRGGVYTAVFNKPGQYRGWHKLNSKSHYCDPTHWMPLPQPPKGE